MLVDDLHWADKATLDVVTLAAERLGTRQIVVVGAFRPPEIVPGSLLGDALGRLARATAVTRVSMSPLSAADVARLMELTTGTAPSPEVADRVQSRAGGNPLFVAELARLAGERGVTDENSVPEAIRDVVRSRLAQLPDDSTLELQVAATLGERFDLRTAMAASERDADGCLDALDAAIVTRILVPDGDGYRFAHALVRDAVLAQLTPLRRARLHHRAAEALLATRGEGPDQAEPIAHHRLAAVAVADPVVAARAAIRASDVARWRGALDAADALAERALEVLTDLPRTGAVEDVEVEALEAIAAAAYRRDTPDAKEAVAARVLALAERTGSDAARALGLFLNWDEIDETDDLDKISDEQARALAERTTDRYALVTTRYMVASRALLVGELDDCYAEIHRAITAAGPTDPDERPQHVPLVLVPVVAAMVAAVRGEARGGPHPHPPARPGLAVRTVGGRPHGAGRAGLQPGADRGAARVAGGRAAGARRRRPDRLVRFHLPAGGDVRGARRLGAREPRRRRRSRARVRRDGADRRRPRARPAVGAAHASSGTPCSRSTTNAPSPRSPRRARRASRVASCGGCRRRSGSRRSPSAGSATRERATALLDEAEALAERLGAGIVLPRIAASR